MDLSRPSFDPSRVRQLHRFDGGIHPPQHKEESTRLPIVRAPLPPLLVVPLHQQIGNAARAVVQPGERVLKGQAIGAAEGYVSAAVHAPTSGTVVALEMRSVPHPSGLPDLCVVIEPDGEERWIERRPLDYRNMDPSALRNRVREAGIVGLGGALFPSFIKLNPGPRQRLRTLVINGAECEPYITCDDLLMRERPGEIVEGARLMEHMLRAEEVVIGIEDNKPQALAAMRAAVAKSGYRMEVVAVPTVYPAGGAKQLIKVLTGIEVPSGMRSTEFGVQCFNVATAYSLHRFLHHGEPVISRIVTVTGNVSEPRNFEVAIGTPVRTLLELAGALPDSDGIIMGGPLMGFRLPSDEVPVTKATNCLIASSPALFPPQPSSRPCIRCGECARACPARLQPMELYAFAKSKNFGKAQEYGLFDCIECGCCSYVCPSAIPLVHYYRYAKSEIWAREREKKAAQAARSRHELRLARIAREKEERFARLAQKTGAAFSEETVDPKQAAIQAALERARALRQRAQAEQSSQTNAEKGSR